MNMQFAVIQMHRSVRHRHFPIDGVFGGRGPTAVHYHGQTLLRKEIEAMTRSLRQVTKIDLRLKAIRMLTWILVGNLRPLIPIKKY